MIQNSHFLLHIHQVVGLIAAGLLRAVTLGLQCQFLLIQAADIGIMSLVLPAQSLQFILFLLDLCSIFLVFALIVGHESLTLVPISGHITPQDFQFFKAGTVGLLLSLQGSLSRSQVGQFRRNGNRALLHLVLAGQFALCFAFQRSGSALQLLNTGAGSSGILVDLGSADLQQVLLALLCLVLALQFMHHTVAVLVLCLRLKQFVLPLA